MTITNKSYSELIRLTTFRERYEYLRLDAGVGDTTFGGHRHLNQVLYRTPEWKRLRREINFRDNGCDLGCDGYEINGRFTIHHINPISIEDILERNPCVFDPENLILTTHRTHNAIHYGSEGNLIAEPIIRTKNDTCPWKT